MFEVRSVTKASVYGESENPHDFREHEQDSQKLNTFCAESVGKMYGPFFFAECTMTGVAYLDKLASGCYPS